VTLEEAYTSLKSLYKQMMFPKNPYAPKWTMAQIDEMDVHFFNDLMNTEEQMYEKEVYLSEVW
jgi:hypothetical protein